MARLLVRNVEDKLVRTLKRRAQAAGCSAEEEHRRILREALLRPSPTQPSLAAFLLSEQGSVAPDIDLEIPARRP